MTSDTKTDPIAADALNRVAAAAEKIGRLEPRMTAARAELHDAIREAHREGASVSLIARVSGLSRQRVDQLVKQ